jgi:hypothetical protein
MDHFEDIPPDLTDIDERLRANRPVADPPTLDRVMTRAQRVRSRRLFSLPPAPAAPRARRSRLAVGMATLVTVVGSTGVATAMMGVDPVDAVMHFSGTGGASGSSRSSGSELQLNAANSQYCEPTGCLPVCSTVKPDTSGLWPPNHKYALITLSGATDPNGDTVTLTVTTVTQDEPINGLGDGDTSPDAQRAGANQVSVRAERSGTGDGRVYRIAFTGNDGNGNECTGSVTVSVSHNQGQGAVDSGQGFNSFG